MTMPSNRPPRRRPAARRVCAAVFALAALAGCVGDDGGARPAPGDWVSIHFSQERDGGFAWGMAWNDSDRASAARAALAECRGAGGTRCAEAGTFRNICGALAVGDDNGFGTGHGGTAAEAERYALVSCRSENAHCRIEAAQCSGDSREQEAAEQRRRERAEERRRELEAAEERRREQAEAEERRRRERQAAEQRRRERAEAEERLRRERQAAEQRRREQAEAEELLRRAREAAETPANAAEPVTTVAPTVGRKRRR